MGNGEFYLKHLPHLVEIIKIHYELFKIKWNTNRSTILGSDASYKSCLNGLAQDFIK
jgi:hypothetical protein